MSKRIIIFGHNGQDGQIFWERFQSTDDQVIGIGKSSVDTINCNFSKNIQVENYMEVEQLICDFLPDHIYYLAACNQSSQDSRFNSLELLELSLDVNVRGISNILEAISKSQKKSKIFYAATSMVFEGNGRELQNEESAMTPKSIYSITKATAVNMCRYYRDNHDVFVNVGFLFNHESIYRKESFLSKKIMLAADRISKGSKEKLQLGTIDAEVDWSYAPDFVSGIEMAMDIETSQDFIFSSGIKHTVKDFVSTAFKLYDLNWEDWVTIDGSILNRKRVPLIGDNSKLKKLTGWKESCNFEQMVENLKI